MKSLQSSLCFVALLCCALLRLSAQPDAFITRWKTNNPGPSNNTSVTIPALSATYNYEVDWNNDGIYDDTGISGPITHDFGTAGTYTIRIRGAFPRIYFYGGSDALKIIDITQWGTRAWTTMQDAFFDCNNLHCTATDIPNMSAVTSMARAFKFASSFNTNLASSWDVSNVTNMYQMFKGATLFDADISSWDVSSVTMMHGMFNEASAFNADISGWDVSNVTRMQNMFSHTDLFNRDISSWDVSNVTDMNGMFAFATVFDQNIGSWIVSNVTDMRGMFFHAPNFNQNITSWDVSSVTDMNLMFSHAAAFDHSLGNWDVTSVTNMFSMLDSSGLSVPNYDNTLIGWSNQNVQPNIFLGSMALVYCLGEDARDSLIISDGWTVWGDTMTCVILKTEFGDFSASLTAPQSVQLDWTITSENDNMGLEIQRSTDTSHWEALDFVQGNGTHSKTSTYHFTDHNPAIGFNYYRLMQLDLNGKFQYSKIVVEKVEKRTPENLFIYPNPATNFVTIPELGAEAASLKIFNTSGQDLTPQVQFSSIDKLDISSLPSAVYILKTSRGFGKFIKL